MEYPVQFSVDYPDRRLSRLSTALRIFWVIPIVIVLGTGSGQTWQAGYPGGQTAAAGAGGALFPGPLLMIMFRRKYPRWWFDWNLELGRFLQPRQRLPGADGRPVPLRRRSPVSPPGLPLP
jgi:hypothetical protein